MTASVDLERDAPSTPRPRERAGRYELFAEIGSGGMARVQIGRLLGASGFARTVAIKRPLPAVIEGDADFRRLVINEARLASRVHHPNVVATLDVIEQGHEPLVVMEYVHGESLSVLMRLVKARGERVPLEMTTALLAAALRGLHAVHQARDERGHPLGLIHRDISPQNILCGADGLARLSDFGLAKAVGDAYLTESSEFKGKLTYASPEQIGLRPLTQATDLYSMGLVLWELLAGERIYEGLSPVQIVAHLASSSVVPPWRRSGDVPASFDAIVERAIRRDPAERFPSALEMAQAIEVAGPMASIPEVAAWVRDLASELLARRERLVIAAERRTMPSRHGSEPMAIAPAPPLSRTAPLRAERATPSRSFSRLAIPSAGLLGGLALGLIGIQVLFPGTFSPGSRGAAADRGPSSVDAQALLDDLPPANAPNGAMVDLEPLSARSVREAPAFGAGSTLQATKREARPLKRIAFDCSPPFSLDEQGIRHMKPGCE